MSSADEERENSLTIRFVFPGNLNVAFNTLLSSSTSFLLVAYTIDSSNHLYLIGWKKLRTLKLIGNPGRLVSDDDDDDDDELEEEHSSEGFSFFSSLKESWMASSTSSSSIKSTMSSAVEALFFEITD